MQVRSPARRRAVSRSATSPGSWSAPEGQAQARAASRDGGKRMPGTRKRCSRRAVDGTWPLPRPRWRGRIAEAGGDAQALGEQSACSSPTRSHKRVARAVPSAEATSARAVRAAAAVAGGGAVEKTKLRAVDQVMDEHGRTRGTIPGRAERLAQRAEGDFDVRATPQPLASTALPTPAPAPRWHALRRPAATPCRRLISTIARSGARSPSIENTLSVTSRHPPEPRSEPGADPVPTPGFARAFGHAGSARDPRRGCTEKPQPGAAEPRPMDQAGVGQAVERRENHRVPPGRGWCRGRRRTGGRTRGRDSARPRSGARACSRSRCGGREPQIRRDAVAPAPWARVAARAASATWG